MFGHVKGVSLMSGGRRLEGGELGPNGAVTGPP